jgi:hypothetical protein
MELLGRRTPLSDSARLNVPRLLLLLLPAGVVVVPGGVSSSSASAVL